MCEPPDGERSPAAVKRSVPLDARLDRLSLMADIATRLLMDEQPEAVAPNVYALLAAHLDLDVFLNYVVDGDVLRLASCDGVPDTIRARIARLSPGEAACGRAALQRAPFIAERVHESPGPVFQLLRDLGVRAYACHPLVARQQLVGTLAFGSTTRDHFAADELRLMSTVANQAAVAVERGRLLMANAREQEARRSAENTLLKALQDSETRLRTVLDILPVGVFIADDQARITLVNRAANRIWGHPPVARAREDYSAYRGRWTATGRPVEPWEWGLPRAVSGVESLDREMEIEAADGERRTIVNSAVPIRDAAGHIVGGVAVDWDITERKRAEDALRRNEATLAQAGKMASLGAWHIEFSPGRHVNENPLHWSDEVYRIFGYEPGEVEVTNDFFFEHVHADDRRHVEDEVARALAERRSYAIEHRIVRRDGRVRVVFEHADITFNEHGDPLTMTGAVQDVTERKQAEEALRQADRRKNEFLATLSHELRNPLAAIRYAVELLEKPHPTAPAATPKEVIERQLRHLVHMVDDLLDITRIESNKVRLRRSIVELGAILRQAVEAADPEIREANHQLRIDLPLEPVWLDADGDRLAQVVTNLLNNAARYTQEGGVISLAASADDNDVTIRIADTGVGLAAADLARVFEMFTQVGNPGGGLGIGLALVKRLVGMHGGTVEAHSDGPGTGSEFTVRLPRVAAPDSDGSVVTPNAAQAIPRHRVLVVEDNTDAAEMMATLLRLHGHDVRVAHDGPAALDIAAGFLPDVGLFDIGLPGMSGYELASCIRRVPSLERMFLVAITGWGQEEDRTRAREAGFDAHVTKPAEPEVIERLLARSAVHS